VPGRPPPVPAPLFLAGMFSADMFSADLFSADLFSADTGTAPSASGALSLHAGFFRPERGTFSDAFA
jgi:hypothetical protein